jgi:hypothetical protein
VNVKLLEIKSFRWLIFGICIGCKVSPIPAPPFTAVVYYKSQGGADLLNPQTSGYFDKDGIRVLDVFTNAKGVSLTIPSHLNDYEPSPCSSYVCQPDATGFYSVQFVVNTLNNVTKELIQLNTSVTDTLTYQTTSAAPEIGYLVNKIFYKGQVVWTTGTDKVPSAVITIVK